MDLCKRTVCCAVHTGDYPRNLLLTVIGFSATNWKSTNTAACNNQRNVATRNALHRMRARACGPAATVAVISTKTNTCALWWSMSTPSSPFPARLFSSNDVLGDGGDDDLMNMDDDNDDDNDLMRRASASSISSSANPTGSMNLFVELNNVSTGQIHRTKAQPNTRFPVFEEVFLLRVRSPQDRILLSVKNRTTVFNQQHSVGISELVMDDRMLNNREAALEVVRPHDYYNRRSSTVEGVAAAGSGAGSVQVQGILQVAACWESKRVG